MMQAALFGQGTLQKEVEEILESKPDATYMEIMNELISLRGLDDIRSHEHFPALLLLFRDFPTIERAVRRIRNG